MRGSDHAAALGDWSLAQRLASAAGDSFAARLAHARALAGGGQSDRAAAELTALEREPGPERLRARLAIAQAQNAFWGLGDHHGADTPLRAAEAAIADRRLREGITALRIGLIGVSGRPREALTAARPLLEDPEAGESACLHAALTVMEALLATGRTSAAEARPADLRRPPLASARTARRSTDGGRRACAARHASARAAAARAEVWLAACEGARSPALVSAPAQELTRREHEIALLAASGLSSREIADRLVLSVRTVDSHLQRTYRKLGFGAATNSRRSSRAAHWTTVAGFNSALLMSAHPASATMAAMGSEHTPRMCPC